jgi:selenocysteine-specific elongation factor
VSALDVRLATPGELPARPLLHVGATAVSAHVRPLDEHLVRLVLERPLPLRIGDRALLRDPGSRRVWGVVVVDPAPPELRRRGAAGRRAKDLAGADGTLADEVARRGLVHRSLLHRIGVDVGALPAGVLEVGDWLVSAELATELRDRMSAVVRARQTALEPGVPVGAVARDLDLPSVDLVSQLVQPPLRVADGRVFSGQAAEVPARLLDALEALRADLARAPYAAPDADRLAELGLDQRSLAALAKAGHLLRLADTVVLLPGADTDAVARLATLPQPFTTSEARKALGTTRRVALPLLAHLDRRGLTTRLPDDRRQVRASPTAGPAR